MPKLYLDSSSIVKRYIEERGSESASLIYRLSDTKEISITFSLWNIGETIGVIDQYCQKGWITTEQQRQALRNLAGESLRLLAIDALDLVPVSSSTIAESWSLIERLQIYEADALQIATCKQTQADFLVSADRSLLEAANKEKITAINIENADEVEKKIRS